MGTALTAIFNFLSNPPGSLVYHLVTGCALFLTGLLAFLHLRPITNRQKAKHILIGCAILLLIQFVLIWIFTWDLETFFNIPFFNNNIEHLASALTIIWLTWTFLNGIKSKIYTGITLFLSLVLIIGAGIIIIIINLPLEATVNARAIDIIWQTGSLLLLAMGATLLIFKRRHHWALGLAILIVLGIGHFTQILISDPPLSHLGAIRFAQTLCLPWVLVLTQRFVGERKRPSPGESDAASEVKSSPALVDTKPKLMDLLLKINLQGSKQEKHKTIVKALSLSLVADICYLVYIPEDHNTVQMIIGYDLIREEYLPPATLTRTDLHHILQAWQQNQTLILTQNDPITRDATVLSQLIKCAHIGNLLAYPLSSETETLMGGVFFLTPYTGKYWQEKAIILLSEIKDTLAKVLFTPDPQELLSAKLAQAQIEIEGLRKEKESYDQALTEKNSLLQAKVEELQQFKAKYQIEKFDSVKTIERLSNKLKNQASQDTLLRNISDKLEQLTNEIRQLRIERDELKTLLSRTTARIRNIEDQTGQTGPIRLTMGNQIISLDSIAANIKLKFASQLQKKEITLEINNPDGRQMIKTDPERLQSISLNLLQNALKASKRKGIIQFSQKLTFETGMLIIQVTDFGEGLTPAEQNAFFSAAYETIPGIGSVQSLREAIRDIRVLNGKIWLRSKKEDFTTFRVQLPVRIID